MMVPKLHFKFCQSQHQYIMVAVRFSACVFALMLPVSPAAPYILKSTSAFAASAKATSDSHSFAQPHNAAGSGVAISDAHSSISATGAGASGTAGGSALAHSEEPNGNMANSSVDTHAI